MDQRKSPSQSAGKAVQTGGAGTRSVRSSSANQGEEEAVPFPNKQGTSTSGASATGGGMSGARRSMSWRRNPSSNSGASFSRQDPRRRTASMVDDRELVRRKAVGRAGRAAAGGEAADKRRRDLVAGGAWRGLGVGKDEEGDSEGREEMLLHYQDVREELELSGHNLTSVMNNPRETFMDSLYEAAFEAEPPLPDLEVLRANAPHGLREITQQDVGPFIRKTGVLTRAFERNHRRSAGSGRQDGSVAGGTGQSTRRDSGSDITAAPLEETPRYGLGIRRFRSGANSGHAEGGRGQAVGVAAVTGSSKGAAVVAANGGAGVVGGNGREHDLAGGGSVARCFEQVPGMFFDKAFSLQDPAVFENAVMAAGAEQPERLAHYLDLVEVCLLKQISHRSNAFFEGLKTSQDLQSHVTGACTTLYQLRESMRCMQHDVLVGPMRVPQLQRRKNNYASLEATLELVAGVQQSQAAIQGLLAAEDYLGALDILESAKGTVKNQLGNLQCLKHVGRQLAEYEELVSELLSNRFVNIAVTIPVETTPSSAGMDDSTGSGWGAQAGRVSDSSSGVVIGGDAAGGGKLRRDLDLVVQGLLRLGEMERVLGVVQERVSEDLKLIIRTVVGDFLATTDDTGELMDTFHLFGEDGGGAGDKGSGDVDGVAGEGGGGEDKDAGGESGDVGKGTGVGVGGGAAGGQSVAKLKTLDGEAFRSCLEMSFEHMLSVLTRISQMHEALVCIVDACRRPHAESASGSRREVVQGRRGGARELEEAVETGKRGDEEGGGGPGRVTGEGSVVSNEDGVVIVERSKACLRALSELMERSVSQLLSVRREHNSTKLDVDELKELWVITMSFVQSVERLSGSHGYKLRSTLLSQAKTFVEARHEANKQTLIKRLDAEKWAQADVTPERQAVLDRLSRGQVFPTSAKPSASGGVGEGYGSRYGNGSLRMPSDPPAQPNFAGGPRSGRKGGRGERREAVVAGANYKPVGSALLVAEMAVNFLQFAAHFPAIGTDVLTRLGELLRVFNSRATQLVLGAGAIHSAAKLKSISAKHLALCSQSLGLVRSLIPYMKAALATRLPQKHHLLLAQMDAVAQDYRDHRDKILSKFVSMIEELIEARSSTLKLTDWDTPGGAGGAGNGNASGSGNLATADGAGGEPCQFTADVRKAVTAMHNILQQQLPPEQLQAVFRRMFGVITRRVPACFEREGVSPSTAAGRQRILDDIGFACAALSTLRGVDASSLGLEQAIADIYGKGLMDGSGASSVSGGVRGSPGLKNGASNTTAAASGSVMS